MTIVTAPTSTLFLDPEEVRTRLKAPSSEDAAITRLVGRVSRLLASQLSFEPWYQQVLEEFRSDPGTTINLTNRPFVRMVSMVDTSEPDTLFTEEDGDFEVIPTNRRSGEVYIHRPKSWIIPSAWGGAVGVKWKVTFWSGWWMPMMAGPQPEDVKPLPEDLAEAAWITCQFRYSADTTNPAVAEVSKGGARVTFRDRNASAFPRGYNTDVGSSGIPLPAEVMSILSTYLPIV